MLQKEQCPRGASRAQRMLQKEQCPRGAPEETTRPHETARPANASPCPRHDEGLPPKSAGFVVDPVAAARV